MLMGGFGGGWGGEWSADINGVWPASYGCMMDGQTADETFGRDANKDKCTNFFHRVKSVAADKNDPEEFSVPLELPRNK